MKRTFLTLLVVAAASSALAQVPVAHRSIRHALPAQTQAAPPNITVQPSAAPAVNVQTAAPQITVQPAAPAQPSGGLINIGQAFNDSVAPYINAAVNALILGLVGFLAKRFTDTTGVQIDLGHRNSLVRALQNQAGSLLADGKVKMQGITVHVDSDALANAANNMLKSIPDAEKHFGLTPDYVEKRIVDMIPQTSAGAALVSQAHGGDAPATAADVAAGGAAVVSQIEAQPKA